MSLTEIVLSIRMLIEDSSACVTSPRYVDDKSTLKGLVWVSVNLPHASTSA